MEEDRVRIKRCCASCAHKRLTRTTLRYCNLHDELKRSSEVCDEWMMNGVMRKLIMKNEE